VGNEGSIDSSGGTGKPSLILPIANEFSPGAPKNNPVSLQIVLRIVSENSGRDAQVEAIRSHYFYNAAEKQSDPQLRRLQQKQLASNVLIGMDSFKIYDEKTEDLTDIGAHLLSLPSEFEANRSFAKHILLTLNGTEILRIIRSMEKGGRAINKTSLAEELNRYGFVTKAGGPISTSSKNHLILLSWLRKANVLPKSGYNINNDELKAIIGTSVDDADDAIALSDRQKVFASTLRRDFEINGVRDVFVKDLRALCQAQHPTVFGRTDDLRKAIINPLVMDGWITHSETKGGRSKGRGRGGASGTVSVTEKLVSLDPEYLGLADLAGIPGEVRNHLSRPITQIIEELSSDDTGVKGLALETLSVRILYELGLTPVAFRERGSENNGAEVDLIAEGADTHFHRWMVQCKNMAKVPVSALAKEIGMAVLYKAQVILIITTGEFTKTVHLHAKQLSETSSHQAILIDKFGLQIYFDEGVTGLFREMGLQARDILEWKLPQRRALVE
tara:strand:+ start:1277 stop:2782 length:1506 start_codon:yes stop_codon:yes gene_type:complete